MIAGLHAEVVAVRVARRAFARFGNKAPLGPLTIASQRYGRGYGHFDADVERAVLRGHSVGLTLETTYSGKAFARCLEDLTHRGGPALFWQTSPAIAPPVPTGALSAELEALLVPRETR